jgi:hypothetical protein
VTRGPECTTRPGPGPRFRVRLRHRAALLPGCRVGAGCDVQRRARRDGSLSSFLTRGTLRFLPEERDLPSFLKRGISLPSCREGHFSSGALPLARTPSRRAAPGRAAATSEGRCSCASHALLMRCSCAAHALHRGRAAGQRPAGCSHTLLTHGSLAAPRAACWHRGHTPRACPSTRFVKFDFRLSGTGAHSCTHKAPVRSQGRFAWTGWWSMRGAGTGRRLALKILSSRGWNVCADRDVRVGLPQCARRQGEQQ